MFVKCLETGGFNLYHAGIEDLNPCNMGLPARL
jgi:hypothetical protein